MVFGERPTDRASMRISVTVQIEERVFSRKNNFSRGKAMEFSAEEISDKQEEIREADALKEIVGGHLRTSALSSTRPNVSAKFFRQLESANKELWVILSMFILAGLLNYAVASQRVLIGLYALPTIMSAYCYGRRHATLTAFASIIFVGLFAYYKPGLLSQQPVMSSGISRWYEFLAWGAILLVMAYSMGTLYDKSKQRFEELQQTYRGLIVILRNFISKDQYTENHCYRVSIYAAKIAEVLGLGWQQIEDIRSAGMLHDLGKLDISRELLYKAAKLSADEHDSIKKHVSTGVGMLDPLSTPLGRVLPIVLAHHEKFDGSGYYKTSGEGIPVESRILSVADVYDALTSDRPYRKAMSPYDAEEIIVKGSGTEFDPEVVQAFSKVFKRGDMDVPGLIV
jgi:putative nucleotidyltransferase with HDIG domain